MAVEDKGARIPYDCDGSQKDFAFGISVYDKADLKVYHRYTELGEEKEELLVDGVGYTISSSYSHYRKGGVVSTTEAYPSPDKIVLLNDPELKQTADYEHGDNLPSQEHENAMDRAYIALQKQRDTIDLALKLMTTSSFKNLILPDPVANMLLACREDLKGIKYVTGANIGDLTVSDWIKNNLLDDANAAAVLTTLGFSAYVQGLYDAADLGAFLTAMGVNLDDITDGTTYKRTPTAVVGNYLKSAGAGVAATFGKLALSDTGLYINNIFNRASSGNQTYPTNGVKPSAIIFLAVDHDTAQTNLSVGFSRDPTDMCIRLSTDGAEVGLQTDFSIYIKRGTSNEIYASAGQFLQDTFLLSWTLVGTAACDVAYLILP